MKFRGKNLAQLYAYILSRRKKKSKGCRYTDSQLLEMASIDPNSKTRKELIFKINEMCARIFTDHGMV